jgi:ribosomal protein S18 acetylase RimI-like enzyme
VLLAEPGGGAAPVGYAVVRHAAAHPLVAGPAPVELQRIYVDARAIGRGVGSVLLGAALANAANAGEATMWLAVWEQNARAIAFYERSRFATVGAQPFQIGSVVHRDLVMARPVGAG